MPGFREVEYAPNFQALSLFRILLAFYLLVEFAAGWRFYPDFFTDRGILPLSVLAADRGVAGIATMMPLLRLVEASGIWTLIPILYPLALVALALGWRTRRACGLAFFCASYLYWRNPYLLSGAEILARLLLLWSLFLPLNRYWSVDAALDPESRRRSYPALPFFALRLQIASLYFFSALFKLEGLPWRDGFALAWTLQDTLFAGRAIGEFFVHDLPWLLVGVNYLVIVFQLAFPYLIYSPWRNELTRAIAIAGSAAMHLSFIVFLTIGGFPYLCLIMLTLLVPDRWIDCVLEPRRARLRRMAIYYEPGCVFCEKVSLLLREFLLAPDVAVLPASEDPAALRLLTEHRSWVVMDRGGALRLKWRAMAYVVGQAPLLAPLGWLSDVPALRPPMQRFYDFVGAHRRALGAVTRVVLPWHSDRVPGRWALALNGALAAAALACNIVGLDRWSVDRAQQEIHAASYAGARNALDEAFAVLQIRQVWTLFSPVPTHWRWHFSFLGIAPSGETSDIAAAIPFIASSNAGAVTFAHLYWAKYFSRFALFTDEDWRALGDYLCRAVAHNTQVTAVEIGIELTPVAEPHPGGSELTARRRLACGASM